MSISTEQEIYNPKARLILDWDDGEWYITTFETNNSNVQVNGSTISSTAFSGFKLTEWDKNYTYEIKDLVGYDGNLYRSLQSSNLNNKPGYDAFWWQPLFDLSNVDAKTFSGLNIDEVKAAVLDGNLIDDFYKKAEIDNKLIYYFNNVNAKKLEDKTLEEIIKSIDLKINNNSEQVKSFVEFYLNDTTTNSFQDDLIKLFDSNIYPDSINR